MSKQEDLAREVMARAIRRLNILEYLILGAAAALATGAGAATAWVLSATLDAPFRLSWLVSSILFFGIPGALVYGREVLSARRRDEDEKRQNTGRADGG
ncbi:MAG: hypothetical protein GWM92_15155 [Gemmatimonadetes bacterium]|nr:hypothetical protein [Gemmatimonadota bacterium]NIR80087.1 hypothetical protein [Gemmatimonadota bacterium]NIT88825.1 hypothetical protein [Gemmatimonadota bacterium]NIU32629.1 hypothetical protein [Gemmatimonadota bacterium]NIU37082.1 hypothetical protein [Gemmatimonadota bacterium]